MVIGITINIHVDNWNMYSGQNKGGENYDILIFKRYVLIVGVNYVKRIIDLLFVLFYNNKIDYELLNSFQRKLAWQVQFNYSPTQNKVLAICIQNWYKFSSNKWQFTIKFYLYFYLFTATKFDNSPHLSMHEVKWGSHAFVPPTLNCVNMGCLSYFVMF